MDSDSSVDCDELKIGAIAEKIISTPDPIAGSQIISNSTASANQDSTTISTTYIEESQPKSVTGPKKRIKSNYKGGK